MAKKTNKKHSEHDAQPDCVKDENRPNQAASTEESTADQATDQETVNSAETDTSSEEQSETEKLQKDLHDLSEKHMRLMAEYDNFRRRSKQEKEELYNASLSDVVADWLPVIDNLKGRSQPRIKFVVKIKRFRAGRHRTDLPTGHASFRETRVKEIAALGETS